MELFTAVLQDMETFEIVETYTFDDLEVCESFVDTQNDKLAERGLPALWCSSEGR